MTRFVKSLLFSSALILIIACGFAQPAPDNGQVATLVAMTFTALYVPPSPTSSPIPTSTALVFPTPTFSPPTIVPPTVSVATAKPDYACDFSNQPYDDAAFRRNEDFDIRWTIINTGTQRWENGTHLAYQNGPKMTTVKRVDLPRLKPGERYVVALDATAPDERDRQVMVWAVVGPGAAKNSLYWMCYPYIRIMVGGK